MRIDTIERHLQRRFLRLDHNTESRPSGRTGKPHNERCAVNTRNPKLLDQTMTNTKEPQPDGPALRRFVDPAYRPLCTSLAQVRQNIDALDRQIVALLAERGRYVKDAARFKRDAFQVSAPARQQEVINKVVRLENETGAYPEVVEACYRALMAGYIAREQAYHHQMIETGD